MCSYTKMSDKASADNNKAAAGVNPADETIGVEANNAPPGQGEPQEPKNVQELTNYIQSMLQQMQDRFQTMSDQVSPRFPRSKSTNK